MMPLPAPSPQHSHRPAHAPPPLPPRLTHTVDQLTKFNQRLADLCPDPRQVRRAGAPAGWPLLRTPSPPCGARTAPVDTVLPPSCPSQRHLIDGIVLTKFDTIDDKVGGGAHLATRLALCLQGQRGCTRRCNRDDTYPNAPPPFLPSPIQVGAALSMVYTSGAPIMFVGCGQTYVDLKKLHVKSVVKSLLK